MRLIDADELKKRVVKVMFRDTPESGEFYAVGTGDIDIMPTIDPESLRPTAHKAVDDACAEYEDSQKIRWNNVVTESAKQNALSMMATLCEQGISMIWIIHPTLKNRSVILDCGYGTHDTWAKSHGYSFNYAKVTFNENAVFNEWIGRFVCLCKLMGETPSDFIMRGINVE